MFSKFYRFHDKFKEFLLSLGKVQNSNNFFRDRVQVRVQKLLFFEFGNKSKFIEFELVCFMIPSSGRIMFELRLGTKCYYAIFHLCSRLSSEHLTFS